MPVFINITIFMLTSFIYILMPASNILSLLAFHQIQSKNDFTTRALYVFFATFIFDTINSSSLGTFAFTWLLLIGPILLFRYISMQVYHPRVFLLELLGGVIFLTSASLLHVYLASVLSGIPVIPSIQQALLNAIVAVVLVLLTKRQISRQ